MDSIFSILEEDNKKDVILTLLEMMVPWLEDDAQREIAQEIFNKINRMSSEVDVLIGQSEDELRKVAAELGVDEDVIVGSFMYFMLLIENALQTKAIDHQMEEINKLKIFIEDNIDEN